MGEQHPLGVAVCRELDDRVDAVVERQNLVQPEAVQADVRSAVHERLEIVGVGGVADVTDHNARQVAALVLEDVLLERAELGRSVVGGDGYAGRAVSAGSSAEALLVVAVDSAALFVGGELDDVCLDVGAGDALGDVLDEYLCH